MAKRRAKRKTSKARGRAEAEAALMGYSTANLNEDRESQEIQEVIGQAL